MRTYIWDPGRLLTGPSAYEPQVPLTAKAAADAAIDVAYLPVKPTIPPATKPA
jgi:hypothetical protein